MQDPWSRLGIVRTNDLAAIRSAYAALLKRTRPDVDPDGFRSLREAFEAARRWAEQNGGAPVPAVAAAPAIAVAPAAGTTITMPPPDHRARDRIAAAIQGGRLVEAAETWRDGVDLGQLSFRDEDDLSLQLARRCGAGQDLDAAALARVVTLMDWAQAGRRYGAAEPILDAIARHAAEQWYLELRQNAAAPFSLRRQTRLRRRAARLLLKPAPGSVRRLFPYLPSSPNFRHWLTGWERHKPALGDRLDPDRLAWCRASMTRTDARVIAYFWRLFMFLFLLQLFIGVMGMIGVLVTAWN